MLHAPLKRLLAQPGHRFALLVVLGMAVIATPLAEVWRRQGLELETALDARRALESVSVSVQTQRALMAHRPYAAAVLAGRSEQESERLRRQQAVDGEMGALVAILETQRMHRALDEADQLRNEWTSLLEGIGRRQMAIAASDAAHDLLSEQVFVIMDLAAGTSGLQGQVGRAVSAEALALALQTLPRLTTALAGSSVEAEGTAGPASAAEAGARRVQLQARRAAQAAAGLLARLDAAGAEEPAPDPALVHALVALRQSTAPLAAADPPAAATAGRARAASIAANAALITHLDTGLATTLATLRQERRVVAAAGLLALFLGTLAAALALPRGSTSPQERTETAAWADDEVAAPRPPDTESAPIGAESQGPASDLLLRLRRREADPEAHGAEQPRPPTLP
jgi:hypothetical protein